MGLSCHHYYMLMSREHTSVKFYVQITQVMVISKLVNCATDPGGNLGEETMGVIYEGCERLMGAMVKEQTMLEGEVQKVMMVKKQKFKSR